jgi:general secretion pathway protein K
MALLITVMTVALLLAVTVEYHKTTWNKFLVSHNYRVGVQLKAVADSGINLAVAVLQSDGVENQNDSFLDAWASLQDEQFDGLFPTGILRVKVDDLSGRLPINSLVGQSVDGQPSGDETVQRELRVILLRLLLSGSFAVEDETEARGIIDAIIDWIDEDDRESDYGAESSYYQSLEKPYDCRNKPIQYIEELLMIRGVTPALLFGSGEKRGLADYLTVYGDDGKINLNTAPPLLIKSLDALINDELVEQFDAFRRDKKNEESLTRPNWYTEIRGWPGDIVINAKIVATKSAFFLITATGAFDTLSCKLVANAQRVETKEVNLLGKKME